MTVVNSKEFGINQEKYFDLAINENVVIKRGKNLFHLMHASDEKQYLEQPILEPDDDFYRALSAEEFREQLMVVLDRVDKKYANK
jgi:hypothetical protein